MAASASLTLQRTFRQLHGVVVSSGLMQKTVKVRVGGQKWNKPIQKFFADPKTHLVHDPNSSLRAGDVVSISPGWRVSKQKRHVVNHIIVPFGSTLQERPPIPTEDERIAERDARRRSKVERKADRQAKESLAE